MTNHLHNIQISSKSHLGAQKTNFLSIIQTSLYIYMRHHVFIKKVKQTGLEVIRSKAKNAA